jgi:3-hydroxyisobutyrate dehydrogenase-like beta-hydroxyacid dehydrogenase
MRIGLIGLGAMGSAFGERALDTGHRLTVWNRSHGKADALVARGAEEAATPAAAVSGCDLALVVLTDDEAVESVCISGGLLDALPPEAVLADVSTVSPALARRLADVGPSGRVLDTPVLGSPDAVSSGRGRFLVGGPAAALSVAAPVLDDLGASTTHCGPSGAGAVMKLVCNLMLVTGVAAMAEGIAVARSQGLSDDLLREVFDDSPVVSPASRMRLETTLDPEHPGWFGPALARKDIRLALGLAKEGGAALRLGPAADELLTAILESGREWPDFAAVIEALGGTRL